MLFNSFVFIFAFLPVTWLGYVAIVRRKGRVLPAAIWLSLCSLFFYGWWNPRYVPLLICSIIFNFFVGRTLAKQSSQRRFILWLGIAANLLLLALFKYADFGISTLNSIVGISLPLVHVALPLGISFFTFTQIAFLVDAYRGKVSEQRFAHYALFVTYFPHLIAGPILHHKEMMPQFMRDRMTTRVTQNLSVGISMFVFGLFKKVVIADTLAPFANVVFSAASSGASLTFWEAWFGALAFTLQLYFDFSGYSEMALGLSRMFGIELPANFNSPYRAGSIIEFWRRWHMTLSRFLRDYLYIPLGGNRKGPVLRYVNLMITMILGGLWHGAGWTFVVWGTLHGVYLCTNHLWRWFAGKTFGLSPPQGYAFRLIAGLLTFAAVVVGWVFFRADRLSTAFVLLSAMGGGNGISVPLQFIPFLQEWPRMIGLSYAPIWPNLLPETTPNFMAAIVMALLPIVWLAPNVIQIMRSWGIVLEPRTFETSSVSWRPTLSWALTLGLLAACAIVRMLLSSPTEFLYFQF